MVLFQEVRLWKAAPETRKETKRKAPFCSVSATEHQLKEPSRVQRLEQRFCQQVYTLKPPAANLKGKPTHGYSGRETGFPNVKIMHIIQIDFLSCMLIPLGNLLLPAGSVFVSEVQIGNS